jgi:DNA-binding response OmpR family regulator
MAETILVIDDDPAMLDFLKQRLIPEGFTVSTTASSEDGINRSHHPPARFDPARSSSCRLGTA